MKTSMIVYGPRGCGKTTHAQHLRIHFGLDRVVDDGAEKIGKIEKSGILYLCQELPRKPKQNGAIVMKFDDAMKLAGAV